MRGLLFVAALVIIVVVVPRILNAWRRVAVQVRNDRRDELVKDPICQTYIVLSRAVTTEVDGARTHFCSRECAARFARGEGRR